MFVTNPSFKAPFSNGMRAVEPTYWRAAEIALMRPWFVVTMGHVASGRRKKTKELSLIGSSVYVVAEAYDVAQMQASPPEGSKLLTVQAVFPTFDNVAPDWRMERAEAIWRTRRSSDPDDGSFIYEVIETNEGRLVPCLPVDEPPKLESLDLVVKFPIAV